MVGDALRQQLLALSREIHADPELAYQEHRAVGRIAALLERHGHAVERGVGGLETAFRCRAGPAGAAVVLLAEYDALPDVGHGCGHNLIAMSNVGAFLIAAEADRLQAGIELLGTPAEESGGGKLDLLEAGAFKEAVAVLSSHPGGIEWSIGSTTLGVVSKRIAYHGLASHAAVSPEKGRNALNAVIRLFVAVDGWRQHLPSDARIHGIITNGGAAQNIVPSFAEAVFGMRSKDGGTLAEMVETFGKIAEGAALQTGTTVEITDEMRLYQPTTAEPTLTRLLVESVGQRGPAAKTGELVFASTDLGNVSQAVPTSAIGFPVADEPIAGHSIAMTKASVGDLGHANALICAEALAEVAVRVATDAQLRGSLRTPS
ncbi:M20 family metallopeptidase [soil metagenome]